MIPAEVLLARAIHAFEAARLQLEAGEVAEGIKAVERGLDLMREAVDR